MSKKRIFVPKPDITQNGEYVPEEPNDKTTVRIDRNTLICVDKSKVDTLVKREKYIENYLLKREMVVKDTESV